MFFRNACIFSPGLNFPGMGKLNAINNSWRFTIDVFRRGSWVPTKQSCSWCPRLPSGCRSHLPGLLALSPTVPCSESMVWLFLKNHLNEKSPAKGLVQHLQQELFQLEPIPAASWDVYRVVDSWWVVTLVVVERFCCCRNLVRFCR